MNPNWTYREVVYPFFGRSLQAWSADKGKWFHVRFLRTGSGQ